MRNVFRKSDSGVKAGDLILTEEPFAYVLSSKERGSRCDNCLEKCRLLKCSGCQFVYYCGKVCQIEAWNDHKWECVNIKRVSPKEVPDAARILAKIINRLKRGDGISYKAYYSPTSFRMWKDLMSHYSDIKKDKKKMDHFTSLCVVLYEFLKDISLPNTVDLIGLYGRMVINSFTILDMDMNSIGTGIYLAASVIDHSCEPNAVATFDGKTISIRAIKDMPTLDWRQIRITYIDLMKTAYERQVELQDNYYFLCQCVRCMDEQLIKYCHAAKCLNTKCDSPVPVFWKKDIQLVKKPEKVKEKDDKQSHNGEERASNSAIERASNSAIEPSNTNGYHNGVENDSNNHFEDSCEILWDICEKCGTKYTEQRKSAFKDAMEYSEVHLQDMKGTSVAYVDVCKYCLERQEGVLHPLNVLHAQTLDHAFDALIQVQLWEQACVYAERLIPCFRFYYGQYHPLLGILHMKYGKILLYKMDHNAALQQFKQAQKILKITHGEKHILYREHLMQLFNQAIIES
ncbi:histone-lysine N-methyltransferase SMYD3 isoform X2 [Aricia agestis]|uniref:histone-lysine N-methyltransferase SMYD3 isoform X2 n=1 Tax=Aricia agestis TaxID=91739 RepID=UPI001C20397C|nr:histone-lysine N-methyltransferase SMYD3 isoform X2 [Aricia agestis]